jgi:hypothetical protein
MTRLQWILVGGSLAVHLGGFVWMGLLPKEKKTDSVAIALAEAGATAAAAAQGLAEDAGQGREGRAAGGSQAARHAAASARERRE